jgi:protein tyrosine/serine phosphatase
MRCAQISSGFSLRLGLVALMLCILSQFSPVLMAQKPAGTAQQYDELPKFHRVNERLYRGAQPREGGISELAALGVNTIINLRDNDERAEREESEAHKAGLRYFNIPLARLGRPADEKVDRALALIDDPENGVVFVHCAHGEDRTGVVIAIYRISREGWTSEQAKEEANRLGMKFWQRRMKDYISDYYRDHAQHGTKPAEKSILLEMPKLLFFQMSPAQF